MLVGSVLKSELRKFIVIEMRVALLCLFTQLNIKATAVSTFYNRHCFMSSIAPKRIVIDPFCLRQFNDPNYPGAKINYSPNAFEDILNRFLEKDGTLQDGYAPFCKHLFLPNFANIEGNIVPILPQNENFLKTGYEARTPEELPVLLRWFPKESIKAPDAEFIDVILYSRDQIRKENAAMGKENTSDAPWGVVSIKAQNVDYEIPMQPITMLRNALGKEQGGSGVPLDREKYVESVEFWSRNAVIR